MKKIFRSICLTMAITFLFLSVMPYISEATTVQAATKKM